MLFALLVVTVATNAAMWAAIVGFFTPIVIQFITSLTTSRQVRALIAFVFCLVISLPTAYFAASLTPKDYVKSAMVVIVLAYTTYEHLWKPIGLTPSTTSQP